MFKKIIFISLLLAIAAFALFSKAADTVNYNQQLLYTLDTAIKSFWESGGEFQHTKDGLLHGWPMSKTADDKSPRWLVDDKNVSGQPVISVLEPGMGATGIAFLEAYEATGNKLYIEHAIQAGKTLLSIQKDLDVGGWGSHAVIIPEEAGLGSATGYWSSVHVPISEDGKLTFSPPNNTYVTLDNAISINGAMFLIELYNTIKPLDFSREIIDPLKNIRKEDFLEGAQKFFNLTDSLRNLAFVRSDFAGIIIDNNPVPTKNGPHPFLSYLAGLPDHPLNHGLSFKPYASGGLPQGIPHGKHDRKWLLTYGGAQYGALAAGYPLHKTFNDHEISQFLLFLFRYYEITGDNKALDNLNIQLNWLVKVFNDNGNRAWSQQYHFLDGKPAPARPWEPPALTSWETIKAIPKIALVEKMLETKYHITKTTIIKALEDALYFLNRVAPKQTETPETTMFKYYTLEEYAHGTTPSADQRIAINSPVISCDYYYPRNPITNVCDYSGYNFYLATPDRIEDVMHRYEIANIKDTGIYFLLNSSCLNDATRENYRGCLDLNNNDLIPDIRRWYWGTWINENATTLMKDYKLSSEGYWTDQTEVAGETRTIINTGRFRKNAVGIAKYLSVNKDDITDSDADGLSDLEEKKLGTDPLYPDSDQDGSTDGEEVNTYNTNPIDNQSTPDKTGNTSTPDANAETPAKATGSRGCSMIFKL